MHGRPFRALAGAAPPGCLEPLQVSRPPADALGGGLRVACLGHLPFYSNGGRVRPPPRNPCDGAHGFLLCRRAAPRPAACCRLLERPLGLRRQRARSVEGASWRKDGNVGAARLSSAGPARPGSGQSMIALPPLGARRVALLDPGDFAPPYDVALALGLIAQGC